MASVSEQGNIQLVGVDFNNPTFIMVGGMSIDDIKIKYNWFLNADVIDAVIGEDKNGLIWYKGTWNSGFRERGPFVNRSSIDEYRRGTCSFFIRPARAAFQRTFADSVTSRSTASGDDAVVR